VAASSQGGDDSRVVLRRLALLRLKPRYREDIQPEFYRFSGKIRLVVTALMMLSNVMTGFGADPFGIDLSVFIGVMSFNMPMLALNVVLAWVIWRGNRSVPAMKSMTYVCATLESLSTLTTIYMSGSVNSHMIVVGMLMVLIYRAFFDYNTGLYVFLLLLVGHWAIVLLESFGAIPTAPVLLADPLDIPGSARVSIMALVTVMMFVTFFVANLVVARLHHKELAIRILRENLAAVKPGQLGRHSGTTLAGTYELGRLLGTGGMGEVYAGKHKRTRRAVAVKVLHPHLLDDPSLLRRFRREAEITGSLGSVHIVEIIDIDQEQDQPFIVLEMLEGRSLSALIEERGQLPFEEIANILAQTAKGLQVAHDAGVVHRDLKPANLFLTRRDGGEVVKILDFGVSKIQGQATAITREFALLGTPDYMSPEQTVGVADEVGAKADIFALGAIAYYMITGSKPFAASSIPALLRRICDEEPVPIGKLRKDAPPGVDDVIAIAMAKRPSERYTSVTELTRDLRLAIRGELPAEVTARAAGLHRAAPASRTVVSVAEDLASDDTQAAALAMGATLTHEE
jgi:tRNA A-37 threonylcarbamoyl transferase component Bud32